METRLLPGKSSRSSVCNQIQKNEDFLTKRENQKPCCKKYQSFSRIHGKGVERGGVSRCRLRESLNVSNEKKKDIQFDITKAWDI